jgi:hypothetical protein
MTAVKRRKFLDRPINIFSISIPGTFLSAGISEIIQDNQDVNVENQEYFDVNEGH